MSLNAGAGAGSSCPDVAVERRLRVPTLFWSTVQKRSRSSGSCACACRRVPPGGAPGSFIRSARIIRTHGGYIQHSTYNRDTRPLREVACTTCADRHRAAGYTGRWPKPRTQAGPSAVGAARSGGAPARDGSGRGADPSYPDSAAEQPSTHDGPRHRRKSLGLGS